jgi:uncharacterized membrane protein YgcG
MNICKSCQHNNGNFWKMACVHPVAKSLPTPSNHCKFWCNKDDSTTSSSTTESPSTDVGSLSSWNTPEPSCYGGSSNTDSDDTFKSGGGGDFGGGGSSGDW